MLRKAAFVALLPLLLASAAATPTAAEPVYAIARCPGADLTATMDPVRRLFSDHPETRAVMIVTGDCTALKAYAPGYSDANRFISWSMAKTVTAALVGEMVSDGRLQLDAPAPIAEWRQPGDPRGAITLRHLLQMSSGLAHLEVGDPVENSDTNQTLFVSHTGAMAAHAIAQPLATKPGSTFRYSSLTTIILAEIVARQLTNSRDPHERARIYTEFANERLFRPAGITSTVLEYDGAGTQIGGSIMHMNLPDWARFGGLLLDGKATDGTQVIAPEWLAFMKTPSPTNPEYGGQTWLNRQVGEGEVATLFPEQGMPGAVAANGHLGQLVIAGPETGPGRGTVIVRLGNTTDTLNKPLMHTMGQVLAGVEER